MNEATRQDIEHLRTLSIFHYVCAGVLGCCSLLPIVHLFVGVLLITGELDIQSGGNPPPRFFGWAIIVVALFVIVLGLATSLCVAIAGRPFHFVKPTDKS